ncbi:MAG: rhodanese-like domain-containing protein [Flavobacteriales bacterium]|nr:rhodanese-like domain-containing protein [Flavobacteriales bacterium]
MSAGLYAQIGDPRSELSPAAFKAAIAEGSAILVDVRTPKEYVNGHIEGSVNIDWTSNDYEAAFAKLDPKTPVLLYCHGGGRSEQALEYLVEKGLKARHLKGGFMAWREAGNAVVR